MKISDLREDMYRSTFQKGNFDSWLLQEYFLFSGQCYRDILTKSQAPTLELNSTFYFRNFLWRKERAAFSEKSGKENNLAW